MDEDGIPSAQDLVDFNLFSYANDIQFAVTDPAKFCAAIDTDANPGTYSFAPGDGTNIQNLLDKKDELQEFEMGSIHVTGTVEEIYDLSVSFVGGLKGSSSNQLYVAQDRESQVKESQANVSGVSLDEEFSKLINFQRAFEASGRIIKVGDELLAQILALIG